jgi:hypothetical protein
MTYIMSGGLSHHVIQIHVSPCHVVDVVHGAGNAIHPGVGTVGVSWPWCWSESDEVSKCSRRTM